MDGAEAMQGNAWSAMPAQSSEYATRIDACGSAGYHEDTASSRPLPDEAGTPDLPSRLESTSSRGGSFGDRCAVVLGR